jgi:hypothetical protein
MKRSMMTGTMMPRFRKITLVANIAATPRQNPTAIESGDARLSSCGSSSTATAAKTTPAAKC